MARIRTIKPEFWTSDQLAACSLLARLLFIGLWNFCDDYGVHPASPMRLKMEVFPGDNFSADDVQARIDELVEAELLVQYEIDGRLYWHVTGWDRNQKSDTKTGRYPRPDGVVGGGGGDKKVEHSSNGCQTIADYLPPEKDKDKDKEKHTARLSAGVECNEAQASGEALRADRAAAPTQPKASMPPVAIELPDWLPPKLWVAYVEMRCSIRAPLTHRAAKRKLRELEKLRAQGHSVVEVLNESIRNSWCGVFPPKNLTLPTLNSFVGVL